MSVKESELPKEIQEKLRAIRAREAACLNAIDAFRDIADYGGGVGIPKSDEFEFRAKVNGAAAEIARAAKELRDDVKRPHEDRILQEREEADQG